MLFCICVRHLACFVLNMLTRVVNLDTPFLRQIFCGIGCMIMAAVAFIEEKRFNLAVGLVSGALTVMAASKARFPSLLPYIFPLFSRLFFFLEY